MRSPSAPGLGQESCPSAVPTPSRTSEHPTPRLNCPRTSRREQPRKPSSRYFTRARGRGDRAARRRGEGGSPSSYHVHPSAARCRLPPFSPAACRPATAAPGSVRHRGRAGRGGASPSAHLGQGMALPPGRGEPHLGRAALRPAQPRLSALP